MFKAIFSIDKETVIEAEEYIDCKTTAFKWVEQHICTECEIQILDERGELVSAFIYSIKGFEKRRKFKCIH